MDSFSNIVSRLGEHITQPIGNIGNVEIDAYSQVAGVYGYVGYNYEDGVSLGVGIQGSAGIAGYTQVGITLSDIVQWSEPDTILGISAPFIGIPEVDFSTSTGFGLASISGLFSGIPSIGLYTNTDGSLTATAGQGITDFLELGIQGTIYSAPLYDNYNQYDDISGSSLAQPNDESPNWDSGDSPSESGPGPGAEAGEPDADDSETPTEDVTKPVVIDLSAGAAADQASDGLDFYGLYNSPVFFNSDEDAFRERTAWVGPNEGIVTHVSTAKDGATLFEIALTNAVKSQYGIEASTDMEALYLGFDRGIDLNGDGTITLAEGKGDGKIAAAEAESLGLKIWRDADMDGVVDAGEMVSFAEAKAMYYTATNASGIQQPRPY